MSHPYSTRDLVVARLSSTRQVLLEVIGRLSQDFLDWAPSPGMRTVAGQLAEIAGTEVQLVTKLKGEPDLSWTEAEARLTDVTSLEALVFDIAAVRQVTLAYIDTLTEQEFASPSSAPSTWQETIGLEDAPVAEVLRGLAQHEAYHTGQLVSYLWARGDNPYEWPAP